MSVTMLKMGAGSRLVGTEGHDLSVALGTAHHLASSGTRQCIRNGEPHPTSTIVKIAYFEGHRAHMSVSLVGFQAGQERE